MVIFFFFLKILKLYSFFSLESALEGLVTNFFEKIPGTVDAFFFPSEDNEHKLVKLF